MPSAPLEKFVYAKRCSFGKKTAHAALRPLIFRKAKKCALLFLLKKEKGAAPKRNAAKMRKCCRGRPRGAERGEEEVCIKFYG